MYGHPPTGPNRTQREIFVGLKPKAILSGETAAVTKGSE